ncbi:MAG TPA: hypothetical protein VIL86_08620 [Tepidisphaeraceae bacterium]|jgi:hypothetical protein
MADDYSDLGTRVVRAARLAVAMHLQQSLAEIPNFRRKAMIGGAGPAMLTDELTPRTAGDRVKRSSLFAGERA